MTKRIDSLVPSKEIKGADKDDICLTQIIVIDSFIEEIHIDHALIVTCPSRQFSIPPLCRLHLNVIDGSRVIFNVDVETHGLAVKAQIDTLLRIRIVDIANPYIQNTLQQPFTELLILEAMKMQNEIAADADGTVKAINVTAGQSVKVRDSLVILG